jgi:hypothetical protein
MLGQSPFWALFPWAIPNGGVLASVSAPLRQTSDKLEENR